MLLMLPVLLFHFLFLSYMIFPLTPPSFTSISPADTRSVGAGRGHNPRDPVEWSSEGLVFGSKMAMDQYLYIPFLDIFRGMNIIEHP